MEQMVNALVPQVVDGTSERVRVRTAEQFVHAPIPVTRGLIVEQLENFSFPQIAVVPAIKHVVDDVHNATQQFLLMVERIAKHCEAAKTAVVSLPPLDGTMKVWTVYELATACPGRDTSSKSGYPKRTQMFTLQKTIMPTKQSSEQ